MDPRTSVKNLAITCLVSLYDVFGESMLQELMESSDIKASQVQAVKDAISYKNTHSDGQHLPADNLNHYGENSTGNNTVNHATYGQDSNQGKGTGLKGRDDVRDEVTSNTESSNLSNNVSSIPLTVKAGQGQGQGMGGLSRTRDLSAPKRNPVNRLALTSKYMHVHRLNVVVCCQPALHSAKNVFLFSSVLVCSDLFSFIFTHLFIYCFSRLSVHALICVSTERLMIIRPVGISLLHANFKVIIMTRCAFRFYWLLT